MFAYASEADYRAGAGYNRGRLFWNNGGPIEVDICTEFADLRDGIDFCSNEYTFTVENR